MLMDLCGGEKMKNILQVILSDANRCLPIEASFKKYFPLNFS